MCFALTKIQFMYTRLPQIIVCDIDCLIIQDRWNPEDSCLPQIWPGALGTKMFAQGGLFME
jgi:hypothetical protein